MNLITYKKKILIQKMDVNNLGIVSFKNNGNIITIKLSEQVKNFGLKPLEKYETLTEQVEMDMTTNDFTAFKRIIDLMMKCQMERLQKELCNFEMITQDQKDDK